MTETAKPSGEGREVGPWFRHLRDLAQEWVERSGGLVYHTVSKKGIQISYQVPTDSYVDLTFAFGLARLGAADAARELLGRARAVLGATEDDAHQFLLTAYTFRITQALEGKPHSGPLPAEQIEHLEHMERLTGYLVDRLRRHARVLEPDEKIDPYRRYSALISAFNKALAELTDLTDPHEVADRVRRLLSGLPEGKTDNEARARVLRAGLEAAPRINEEFARQMLDQAIPAYDALPEPRQTGALVDQAAFLERALFVAAHFELVQQVHPLVERFRRMLQAQRHNPQAVQALDSLAGQCFRGLRKLGMRDEIDQLLGLMAEVILGGQELSAIDFRKLSHGPAALRALLRIAAGWYYLGRETRAEEVIRVVRTVLFEGELDGRDQTALACSYALTVGQAPVEVAQKRLEEIFRQLKGVKDTYSTRAHFSVSQLGVVEAVVLAVVEAHTPPQADLPLTVDSRA
jgi:hypothetical protein